MKKDRKFFWCYGSDCGNTFQSHAVGLAKHPISELAQELKGASLCQTCYDKGLRLRMAPQVYRVNKTIRPAVLKGSE